MTKKMGKKVIKFYINTYQFYEHKVKLIRSL